MVDEKKPVERNPTITNNCSVISFEGFRLIRAMRPDGRGGPSAPTPLGPPPSRHIPQLHAILFGPIRAAAQRVSVRRNSLQRFGFDLVPTPL